MPDAPAIVVADAGPLIILARTVGVEVLRCIAPRVLAPAAVIAECTADPRKPGARMIRAALQSGCIQEIQDVDTSALPQSVIALLGTDARKNAGEREAIALALATDAVIVLDDSDARRAASGVSGLIVVGTAKVLAEAHLQGKLAKPVEQVFADMEAAGFFLGPKVKAAMLAYLRSRSPR